MLIVQPTHKKMFNSSCWYYGCC